MFNLSNVLILLYRKIINLRFKKDVLERILKVIHL